MKVEELLTNEVIERFRQRKESLQERDALVSLASKVLCRKVSYTCRNCYFDALMELVSLYKTNRILFKERMEEKRYQIKRGVCMPLGFGSNRMIVYQNCTDQLAVEFLSLNEKNSQYFEHLPDGWKDDVAAFLEKQSGKNVVLAELSSAELDAIADMKKMLVEGSTKGAVKEHFQTFEKIGGVKVTKKYVDSLLKVASGQLEEEKSKNTADPGLNDKSGDPEKVVDVADTDQVENAENADQAKVD